MTQPAKHTPGPWVVNTFIVNGQHKLEVLDATGANACVQANAHLIAAAPAMYEALQAIEARLQGVFDSPALMKQGMLTHDKSTDVIRFVQTALAQAEGRQG